MDLRIKIIDINQDNIAIIGEECLCCRFWFKTMQKNILEDFIKTGNIIDLLKIRFFESRHKRAQKDEMNYFLKKGGHIKAAINKKNQCIGLTFFGRHYLFPRIKEFSVYPPDTSSDFLACLLVSKDYKDLGIEQKILISIHKELLEKKRYRLECIGKRLKDDAQTEENDNFPLIPVKFLINNGFYIKKNDDFFPLLRIDLKSIQKVLSEKEDWMEKYILKKKLSKTFLFKKKFN